MKIRVTINGILEAEMEIPDTSTSAMGSRDWNTWHENQHTQALKFISRCAENAVTVAQGIPRELETTKADA